MLGMGCSRGSPLSNDSRSPAGSPTVALVSSETVLAWTSRAVTTTISSSSSDRTEVCPNSKPSNGTSLSPGNPDSTSSTCCGRVRRSRSTRRRRPRPWSPRGARDHGTVTPGMTVTDWFREGSEISGRTVSTIRPVSTTVGTKSSRTPYFLYEKTSTPSSNPVGRELRRRRRRTPILRRSR